MKQYTKIQHSHCLLQELIKECALCPDSEHNIWVCINCHFANLSQYLLFLLQYNWSFSCSWCSASMCCPLAPAAFSFPHRASLIKLLCIVTRLQRHGELKLVHSLLSSKEEARNKVWLVWRMVQPPCSRHGSVYLWEKTAYNHRAPGYN